MNEDIAKEIAERRLKAVGMEEAAEILGMSYCEFSRKLPKMKDFPPTLTRQGRRKWRGGDIYDYREGLQSVG